MTCKTRDYHFAYLRLTDCEDGNVMAIRADVTAVFVETPEKTVVTNLLGQELRSVVDAPPRTIVLAEGYRWRVMESVEEVMDKLKLLAEVL